MDKKILIYLTWHTPVIRNILKASKLFSFYGTYSTNMWWMRDKLSAAEFFHHSPRSKNRTRQSWATPQTFIIAIIAKFDSNVIIGWRNERTRFGFGIDEGFFSALHFRRWFSTKIKFSKCFSKKKGRLLRESGSGMLIMKCWLIRKSKKDQEFILSLKTVMFSLLDEQEFLPVRLIRIA